MASFQRYKTKQGEKWLFKIYVGVDPVTGKHKPTTRRGFKTKKEAQAAAANLQRQIDNGTLIIKTLTYNDVFNEWWETHSKTIKLSTQDKKISIFNAHILKRFGKLKVKNIAKKYCQKMINEIAEEVDSTSTVYDIKIQANLVFKYAVKEDYIEKNPMKHVVVPKKEDDFLAPEEEPLNFWTKEEIQAFLSIAEKEMTFQNYAMFYLLIFTGMRKGELAALEWKDVNFKERTISINKTLYFKDGKEILQTGKSYKSKRVIDIDDDEIIGLLTKLKIRQKELLLSDGITVEVQNVLIRPDLRRIRLAYPNDTLNSFVKTHELHKITIHGLRHTHASLLFASGATIKDAQEKLGHKDIQTTMNVYTHVTEERKSETTQNLRKYMKSN
jgi:integrase